MLMTLLCLASSRLFNCSAREERSLEETQMEKPMAKVINKRSGVASRKDHRSEWFFPEFFETRAAFGSAAKSTGGQLPPFVFVENNRRLPLTMLIDIKREHLALLALVRR